MPDLSDLFHENRTRADDEENLQIPSAAEAEESHQKAVTLMTEMLKQFGYEEAVQIFYSQLTPFSANLSQNLPKTGQNLFVVLQEMDCDIGGGAEVVAVCDSQEEAESKIKSLKEGRWFIKELERDNSSPS